MDRTRHSSLGVAVALALVGAWVGHLVYLLAWAPLAPATPATWLHVALQAWLTTGLFITGHDAMHGSVSRHRWLNDAVGRLSCFLFAGFSYRRLVVHHRAHHAAPTSDTDPDFDVRSGSFWPWLATFMRRYTTLRQVALMALLFNVLLWLGAAQWRVWLFWVLPAVLGTLQLFYFGTYRPHRAPATAEMAPHFARTQRRNHLWALLSCFFFGYHWEHHQSPSTPWWALWRVKDARERAPGRRPAPRPV